MKKHIYLLLALACSGGVFAQFNGGSGDGFTQGITIQLDLTGVPIGVRPLYVGGSGDGADQNQTAFIVAGIDPAQLFQGGSGDGFDRSSASVALSGQNILVLYGGSSGDGFDRSSFTATLGGETFTGLFSGGPGDGFDGGAAAGALNGESLAGLFAGGPGDGFDQFLFAGDLNGAMLTLFAGGAGDGFDEASGNFALNGQSLNILYAGGAGDGFDTELYLGVLPLPLTLISFDAFPRKDFVLLQWVTEDEVATDFFTIEKTRDGRDFASVGTTDAAGDSEPGERLYYGMEDHAPYNGTSFYRLQTTDLDGAISLSHLVEVNYSADADWNFVLFPNPNTGRQLGFRPEGIEPGTDLYFEVLDIQGRALLRREFTVDGSDEQFQLNTPLPSGSYLIRVTDKAGDTKAKILIVK